MEEKIFGDKAYRLTTIRGRSKWIASDGDAINPYRKNQKATVHFNRDGYPCYGGGIPIHLYVATAWVDGYFDGAEVNHKDFNRNNVDASNLEWVSHKENVDYTLKYNYDTVCKSKQGSNNGRARFTESDVIQIRRLYNDGYTIMEIITLFYPNMSNLERRNIWSTFKSVVSYKTWKHI